MNPLVVASGGRGRIGRVEPHVSLLIDKSRPALRGDARRPVRVHLWRAVRPDAPLILLSHGTGGSAEGLAWWASGLCEAGFDVAAIDHHGNTYVDGYVAEAFIWWWDRVLDVSLVIDRLDARGPVGVAGFSIGGWTAVTAVGARVVPERFVAMTAEVASAPPTPEFPGLAEELASRYGAADVEQWAELAGQDRRDVRVRAAFLVCPSLGPLVDETSLASINVPVAVRWAAADEIAPPEHNGMRYAELIPGADGDAVGTSESGHYGFVLPDQVDPVARGDVVRDSIAFFHRTLDRAGRPADPPDPAPQAAG